jgi:thiamine kinase-like enzyme
VSLEACLPPELRSPATTITRIAAGLSQAGVYRVDAAGGTFVLKIAPEHEPLATWRRRREVQQLAANAGLTPRIVHADEMRRAVVSDFVVDRSFPAFYFNPQTRDAAIAQLGRMLRRVHDLPLPHDAEGMDPRDYLAGLWSALDGFALPPFVSEAVRRVLDTPAPERRRAPVLSHNDVNPGNVVYDGENLLLVDWDAAGLNDPLYDLASIAVFARMDDETCRQLLAAHDGEPVAVLPPGFIHTRRLVAALGGAMFLGLARRNGHAGATGSETVASALSLGDFYERMRAGALSVGTAEGQWWFGLALIKASLIL